MKGSQADKFWAFFLQGGRCLLCGEAVFMDRAPHSYGGPTVEHKVPVNHGGAAWRRNRAISHYECNCLRGPRLSLRIVRPSEREGLTLPGRRTPLVPMNGIWYSHFHLAVEDARWERPEQRERMLRRLAK